MTGRVVRTLKARTGREISLPVKKRQSKKHIESSFSLDIPEPTKTKCHLISLAAGKSTSSVDVLYLMLECKDSNPCDKRLMIVNHKTIKSLHKTLDFCQDQDGDRQIFIGPCPFDDGSCLYNINNGKKLILTVYKQPPVTCDRLNHIIEMQHSRRYVSSLLCANYKSKFLLCIQKDKTFYYIRFELGSAFLRMRAETWNIPVLNGVTDFKTITTASSFNGVILEREFVRLVTVDFENKHIRSEKKMLIKTAFVVFFGNDILLHNDSLGGQFKKIPDVF